MSRTRASAGPGISLFPFLAVLLCTMGALLVLLVIFSRSVKDTQTADEAAVLEELAIERASLQWRIEQLRAMRQQMLDDLSQARMGLAGIEDTSRQLSDELAALERELAALSAERGGAPADAEERAALERKLAEATEALEAAQDAAADRPPAYAIVPYEGESGTHRRPLYIECSLDGVFLQPEGIRLSPSDFDGPPGPGNPLASALRAAREHLAERGRTSAAPEEQPYPLLLVRPSGVMAYYAARESIASWGSDFGYQLVEEHWQLDFPAPDLQLADVERRAIEEARTRLAWLEQVQSARVARQAPRVQYRAATTRGGVEVEGGPSVLGDQSRWEWREPGGEGEGNGRGQSLFGSANGDGSGASTGLAGGGPVAGAGGQQTGQGSGGDAVLGAGTGTTGAGYGPGGSPAANGGRYESSSAFAAAAGSAGEGGEPGSGGGREPGGSVGAAGSGAASEAEGSSVDGAGDGTASGAGTSSLAASSGSGGGSGGDAADAAAGGSGGGGTMSMGETGASGMNASLQTGGDSGVSSLASSRGANWASMATRDRPVPLSRPVQIECDANELRILDGSRRRVVVKRVPLGARTADAVDPLLFAVREHVASWGIAGDRMYWNPRLVLSATPQGAGRRADLEALLAGSGLVTARRDERIMAEAPFENPAAEAGLVR